jgi:hypothetical protein
LLLEIKRKDVGKKDKSCYEEGIPMPHLSDCRQECRHITVRRGNRSNKNRFVPADKAIEFFSQNPLTETTVIAEKLSGTSDYAIRRRERPDSVGIFHEMLHWFHLLRHTERYRVESDMPEDLRINVQHDGDNGIKLYLGAMYLGTLRDKDLDNSEKYWCDFNDAGKRCFRIEEMRTILGSCRDIDSFFIEGDDLSENLYRLCIGEPLRYGWSGADGREHESVTDVAKDVCEKSLKEGGYRMKGK